VSRIVVPNFKHYKASSSVASTLMARNRPGGGVAERMLRQKVHQRGLRFVVHARSLVGRPDLVFTRARVAVFCDGDFWHGRRWTTLRRQLSSRANPDYWIAKIGRNRQRDAATNRALAMDGWTVFRLWETDVLKDPVLAADAVQKVVFACQSRFECGNPRKGTQSQVLVDGITRWTVSR